MSNKLKRETLVVDVWIVEPISETAVHKAYDIFRGQFAEEPTQLAMHPGVRNDFLTQIGDKQFQFDSYMGMEFVVERDFEEGAWCVRKSNSKTYAIE